MLEKCRNTSLQGCPHFSTHASLCMQQHFKADHNVLARNERDALTGCPSTDGLLLFPCMHMLSERS